MFETHQVSCLSCGYPSQAGHADTCTLRNRAETLKMPSFGEYYSGTEVVAQYEQLFDSVPQDLRRYLVQSNAILTVAGYKPRTEIFASVPFESESRLPDRIRELNERMRSINPTVRFTVPDDPFIGPRDGLIYQKVQIENLLGYERISKSSHMAPLEEFDRSEGWEGLQRWQEKNLASLSQERRDGIERGYPDIAITDFEDRLASGNEDDMVMSDIPHTGTYEEEDPNFEVRKDHLNLPEVAAYRAHASSILQQVYESPWHRQYAAELAAAE